MSASIIIQNKFSWIIPIGTILLFSSACSPKRMILNQMGDYLDSYEWVYMTENDPTLVKEAFPFNLKTIEMLAHSNPENTDLATAACSGFTMYAYAFVMEEADRIVTRDYQRGLRSYSRALSLFERGRDYGFQALNSKYPGFEENLEQWSKISLAKAKIQKDDVPVLYWTAAAIGGSISASRGDPKYIVDLPKVGYLLEKCLILDPDWNNGSLNVAMISYTMSRPDRQVNAEEQAYNYFIKAVEASNGNNCAPYVAYAEKVLVQKQDREAFETVLKDALQIDVNKSLEIRLSNIIVQERAKWLLERTDELFY